MLLCSSAVLPLENQPKRIRPICLLLARSVVKAKLTLSKPLKKPKHLVILKEGLCKSNTSLRKARQLEAKVCLLSAHPLQTYLHKLLQQVNRRLALEPATKGLNLCLDSKMQRLRPRLKTRPFHRRRGQVKYINRGQIERSIDLVAPREIWLLLLGHRKISLVLYLNLPVLSARFRPRRQQGPQLEGPWLPQLVVYLPEEILIVNPWHLQWHQQMQKDGLRSPRVASSTTFPRQFPSHDLTVKMNRSVNRVLSNMTLQHWEIIEINLEGTNGQIRWETFLGQCRSLGAGRSLSRLESHQKRRDIHRQV